MARPPKVSPDGRLGIRQYALYARKDEKEIRKAIRDGRISIDPDGFIDPRRADAQWAANSVSTTPATAPPVLPGRLPQEPLGDDGGCPNTYAIERAKREHWAAKREKLEFEKQTGLLVPAADIEDQWVKIANIVRTKILAIPTAARQVLPHLVAEDFRILERIARECCEELECSPSSEA